MRFLPIVARELRVASRRRSTYLGRVGAAIVPIVIAGFWLPVFASQFSLSQGKLLFTVLSTIAFAYCLLAGAKSTSDCLSAEKREGTIGLLFLTDLKGYDVVLGKLVSCSLNAFYGLLAIVPVLALALLLGGVTLGEVGRMALLFINTLFFSMAAGVLVSTLSRNDRRAMFATACVILLVCAAPYALALSYGLFKWIRLGRGPQSIMDMSGLLLVSPVFPFQILRSNFVGALMIRDFYQSILATHVLSWILLGLASLIVPRVCRERPAGRLGMRWLVFRNRWSFGSPDKRRVFRARLLDKNAFYWLAARDRIKANYVWFFVGALAVIWCWSGWMIQSFIFDWDVSLWLLFFTFLFFKIWLTSEVCTRLVEDRTSGAFELLLTSPLNLKEMARGQTMALGRQFGTPVLAALGLTYLLMLSAVRSPHSGMADGEIKLLFWSLMIMLIADLITLQWVGMWHAVSTSHVNRATLASCTRVLLLPTITFIIVQGVIVLLGHVSGTANEARLWGNGCLLWLAIGLVNNLFFGLRARWRFLNQSRAVVSQQFGGAATESEPLAEIFRNLRQRLWRPSEATPELPAAGSRLKRAWLWVVPAVVLLLAFVGLSWRKHSLERRVEERLAAIEAAGAPVSVASLRHQMPVVADAENASLLLQKASTLLALVRSPGRQSKKFDWPGPASPVASDFRTSLSNYLAQNEEALRLLHEAVRRTKSRYPIDWSLTFPSSAPWQSLSRLSPAAEILRFEALLQMETGNVVAAVESIQVLLGVANALGQEPFLAGQVYRSQHLRAAVNALERVLNQHSLAADDLLVLAKTLHEAASVTSPMLERAFIGERCLAIDDLRSPSTAGRGGMPATGLQKFVLDIQNYTSERLGMSQRLVLEYLQLSDSFIARSQQVCSTGLQASSSAARIMTSKSGSDPAARLAALVTWWEDTLQHQTETIALLRAAECSLMVERFRAAHAGAFPEALQHLLPDWIPELPKDPFTPGPLQYKRLDHGYIIYSVGRDLQDGGGLESGSSGSRPRSVPLDVTFRVERIPGKR